MKRNREEIFKEEKSWPFAANNLIQWRGLLDVTNHLNDVDGLGMVDRGLVEKLDGVWVAPDEAEE